MRSIILLVVVTTLFVLAGVGLSTAQAAPQTSATTQNPDAWRYTFHNGGWWYWLPTNRWVYWRDNQWNNYDPKTYAASTTVVVPSGDASAGATARASDNGENRPFYGHAVSDLDRRPQQPNSEVGPFYGHALPNEFFGRTRLFGRPYYGRAVSSGQ
jgi:hypothetical protein